MIKNYTKKIKEIFSLIVLPVLLLVVWTSSIAQTTAPDEDTGPYTTCNPGASNETRTSSDLANPVNIGTIDDRSCYADYKESQVFGTTWGVYNITDGSNHLGTSLQPRIERSLPRSKEVGVGSYALFKGTVRILEVGDAAGTASDGTYMMQSKGKHTGGGGSPDPAICLYLVKPVINTQGDQVSFKIYREQIKFRGGSGADGRDIVFLTDIGKNVPTDVELKVGFRQDPNDPTKRIHYSDAIIGGEVFKWNIPEPEKGVESGIRYGAYRVKGGRAQIRWANTTYQKEEVPYDPNTNTNQAPSVSVTSPANNAVFELGEQIQLAATATDADGSIVKVNFKIDDAFYKTVSNQPYQHTFTPTSVGTYKIAARAFDDDNAQTEDFVTITVEAPNEAPMVSITSPVEGAVYELGETIPLFATASDADGTLEKVNFKINGAFYKLDADAPYENSFTPTETGTYVIGARAFDEDGEATEVTVTIEVKLVTGVGGSAELDKLNVFPNPSQSGVFQLSESKAWEVYNLHGEKIKYGNDRVVDISAYPRGAYLLKTGEEVVQLFLN